MSMTSDEREEMTELRRRVAGAAEDKAVVDGKLAAAEATIRDQDTQLQELPQLREQLKRMREHRDRLLWEKNAILEQGVNGIDTILVAVDPEFAPGMLAGWSEPMRVKLEALNPGHRMLFERAL